MMMTSTNSPNAPYVRHNREPQHKSNEGWTVTLKIAIPKPRHWLACSTGWIVIFILYLSSTLWIGGFHKDPYLSSNSSSWNKYLPGPVTTFLPIRAVHDTGEVYEDPMVESRDPFLSGAATSSWSQIGPSETAEPIPLSESKEEIEAIGLNLPGSDPTSINGEEPQRYPPPSIIPEELVERDRNSSGMASATSNVTNAAPAPAPSSEVSVGTEPADSANMVDFEVMDPTLANDTVNGTAFAPDPAPVSDQSSNAKDESRVELPEAPAANPPGEQLKVEGKDPAEPTNNSSATNLESSIEEVYTPQDATVDIRNQVAPISSPSEDSKPQEGKSGPEHGADIQTPGSSVQSPEASDPADSRTTSTWTVIAPGPAQVDGNSHCTTTASSEQEQSPSDATIPNARDSNSAPAPTSTWNPPPSDSTLTVSETKFEPAGIDTLPPRPALQNSEVEPVIRGTSIRGRKAVEGFRNYFDCVSESGKWVYDPTPRLLPWSYVGERYLTKCDGYHELAGGVWGEEADRIAKTGNGTWSVREEVKWVWRTNDTCPLQPVDRDELCRRLGPKRNIMVVGDSLNHGLSWSIMNQLITNGTGYVRFMNYDRTTDGVYEMCGDVFGEGNGFKVSFVRNDRLSRISEPINDDRSNFHEYPWVDLIQNYSVKILLLNRGAHYENDTVYEKALRETFMALRDRYPDVQVIYRNTPPGHANCTNNTAVPPLAQRQEFGWDGVKWPDFYSWGMFAKQNILARKIVEEFEYIYMDVDTMLALRSDGHPHENDCLHYCLPGPSDIGVQLLYNMLPFL